MKKFSGILLAVVLVFTFTFAVANNSIAAKKKFVKFGEDARAKAWKHKKWTTSKKNSGIQFGKIRNSIRENSVHPVFAYLKVYEGV